MHVHDTSTMLLALILSFFSGGPAPAAHLELSTDGQRYGAMNIDEICLSSTPSEDGLVGCIQGESPTMADMGQLAFRPQAVGQAVWAEFGSESSPPWSAVAGSVSYDMDIGEIDTSYLRIRYSKNSPSTAIVNLELNEILRGQLLPLDQGSWDVFVQSPWIALQPEDRSLSFEVEHGQQFGVVELDHAWVCPTPEKTAACDELVLERPSAETGGHLAGRPDAMGDLVDPVGGFTWHFGSLPDPPFEAEPGLVTYRGLGQSGDAWLKVRYSKHSPVSEPLLYLVDGLVQGEVPLLDQGSWEIFTETDWIAVQLGSGGGGGGGGAGPAVWNVTWFGCDFGGTNQPIARDGSPVCGQSNCRAMPGPPPDGCWGPLITEATHSIPGLSWITATDGSLELGFSRDNQLYVETWLLVTTETTLAPAISASTGRLWLNGQELDLDAELQLREGWNRLELTSTNQSSAAGIEIDFDFIAHVDQMSSQPD